MSIVYELRPKRIQERSIKSVVCDVCGKDALHVPQRKPMATIGRCQPYNDQRGNTQYWEIDLCADCIGRVVTMLQARALDFRRELPESRTEDYPPSQIHEE